MMVSHYANAVQLNTKIVVRHPGDGVPTAPVVLLRNICMIKYLSIKFLTFI